MQPSALSGKGGKRKKGAAAPSCVPAVEKEKLILRRRRDGQLEPLCPLPLFAAARGERKKGGKRKGLFYGRAR